VALQDGFHLLDFDTGKLSFLTAPAQPVPGTRFNDGKVSPDGRFWAGTMDEESLSRPIGALYRLDPDGTRPADPASLRQPDHAMFRRP
jgi:sugar lactone lactonase YvrE